MICLHTAVTLFVLDGCSHRILIVIQSKRSGENTLPLVRGVECSLISKVIIFCFADCVLSLISVDESNQDVFNLIIVVPLYL